MLDYDGSNTKVRICLFIGKNLQNIVSDGFLSYGLAYSNFTLLVLWTDSFSNFSFFTYQQKSGNICLKMYQSLSSQLILWLILILCRYSQLVWLLVRLLVRLLVSKLIASKFGDILGLTPTKKSATITSLGGVSLLTVLLMGYCTISSLYNNQKSIMMFCPLNGH